MKKRIIALLFLAFLLVGCNNSKKETDKDIKEESKIKTLECEKQTIVENDDNERILIIDVVEKFENDNMISGKYIFTKYNLVRGTATEDIEKGYWNKEDYATCENYFVNYKDKMKSCDFKIETNQMSKYGYELKAIYSMDFDMNYDEFKNATLESEKESFARDVYYECKVN